MPTDGAVIAVLSMRNLGRVELMGARGAFADELIVGDILGCDIGLVAKALARLACRGLGATKPPEPEQQHDD